MDIREKFVNNTLSDIYKEYKDVLSFSELKKYVMEFNIKIYQFIKNENKNDTLMEPVSTILVQRSRGAIDTHFEKDFPNFLLGKR